MKIKETVFYLLGALLILGFVFLYSSRFLFEGSMPPAINRLYHQAGQNWAIAVNAGLFILFLAFLPYRKGIAWRSKGAFSAFMLALMAEMFGVPLMLYIISPLLPTLFPDRVARIWAYRWLVASGHDWISTVGLITGAWLTLAGMVLVFAGWAQVHKASGLVTTGLYARMRHPQYLGIFLILTGWLIHWPTLPTIIMYPVLLWVYVRLAKKEEDEMHREYGQAWEEYAGKTPSFFPAVLAASRAAPIS